MQAKSQCVLCGLGQIVNLKGVVAGFTDDHALEAQRDAMRRLAALDLTCATPAQIATECLRAGVRASGTSDPFREAKRYCNSVALRLLPQLEAQFARLPEGSTERLLMALQIAAAGNVIDLGWFKEVDVERKFAEAFRANFASSDLDRLVDALSGARRVLYLADNAGEIVLDRLAVSELARHARVTVVVKESPILNDALVEDALEAGLDQWAELITTGEGALGVSPSASPAFWSAFRSADLVLAKGQANFESLDFPHPNLFSLLTAKCPLIAEAVGAAVGEVVLKQA